MFVKNTTSYRKNPQNASTSPQKAIFSDLSVPHRRPSGSPAQSRLAVQIVHVDGFIEIRVGMSAHHDVDEGGALDHTSAAVPLRIHMRMGVVGVEQSQFLTRTMYQLNYQMPKSGRMMSILLQMDDKQKELYEIVYEACKTKQK